MNKLQELYLIETKCKKCNYGFQGMYSWEIDKSWCCEQGDIYYLSYKMLDWDVPPTLDQAIKKCEGRLFSRRKSGEWRVR